MNPLGGNIGWDDKIIVRKIKQPSNTKKATRVSTEDVAEVEKKIKPLNRPSSALVDHRHVAKVDRETDEFHIKRVPLDVSRVISRCRTEKGWSQKDFAMKISESAAAVASYEQGKAIPNQQILSKMERELGVKLRGKDIGAPLPPRGSKAKKEASEAPAAAAKPGSASSKK